MKKHITIALLCLNCFCAFAQINLVHMFTFGDVLRTNIGPLGEKFILANRLTRSVEFYNSDFTIWKSISVDSLLPENIFTFRVTACYYDVFNQDQKPEFFFNVFGSTAGVTKIKVYRYDTDGNSLAIPFGNLFLMNGQYKLVTGEKVLSLPSLQVEHEFTSGSGVYVEHLSLSDYYVVRNGMDTVSVYTENYNLQKKFVIPLCDSCSITNLSLSENIVNNDLNIEYLAAIHKINTGNLIQIGNDQGQILFQKQKASGRWYDGEKYNLPANYLISWEDPPKSTVYRLPDFMVDHLFHNRNIFPLDPDINEIAGKYMHYGDLFNEQIIFYNSNFLPFKTLSVPSTESWYIKNIAKSWFNPDNNLEFFISAQSSSEFRNKIVDENGNLFFEFPQNANCSLSRLLGAKNCIICILPNYTNGDSIFTQIYDLPSTTPLSIKESVDNQNITITPNPIGASDVTAEFEKIPESDSNVRLYDVMGRVVYAQRFPAANTVRIPNAAFKQTGMYWLEVQSGGQKSIRKLVKTD